MSYARMSGLIPKITYPKVQAALANPKQDPKDLKEIGHDATLQKHFKAIVDSANLETVMNLGQYFKKNILVPRGKNVQDIPQILGKRNLGKSIDEKNDLTQLIKKIELLHEGVNAVKQKLSENMKIFNLWITSDLYTTLKIGLAVFSCLYGAEAYKSLSAEIGKTIKDEEITVVGNELLELFSKDQHEKERTQQVLKNLTRLGF